MAYSEKAMTHLLEISKVIFLEVNFEEIEKRIHNFKTRGIAKGNNQTFKELFDERQILYKRYAEVVIDCNRLNQEQLAVQIAKSIY